MTNQGHIILAEELNFYQIKILRKCELIFNTCKKH